MIKFNVPISTSGINDAEVFGSVQLWEYIFGSNAGVQ